MKKFNNKKIDSDQYHPSQHLGVVAIKKGTFGSTSTTIANFTLQCSRGVMVRPLDCGIVVSDNNSWIKLMVSVLLLLLLVM